MSPTEHARSYALTDVGRKRKHNEDSHLVLAELGLFMVADGMGGHAAGEVASAMAVSAVREVLGQHTEALVDRAEHGPRSQVTGSQLLGLLEHAVQIASARIHAEAEKDSSKRGMGTTVSLLLLAGSHGFVAHVGDSRIYLLRRGEIHQVTDDHSVAHELLRQGLIGPEELANVPHSNAITRAVGIWEHVEVDTLTIEVLPDDQFLLCSDGLSGYLDDDGEQLATMLAQDDGDRAVAQLIDFANQAGGKDNITAVLVRLGRGDARDSVRARRVQLTHELLRGMPLFSRLRDRELLRVMQASQVLEYGAGEHVVCEGEAGDQMFVVLEGRLQVRTGKTDLGQLGPGDHFGEMALIRHTPRSATVTALGPSALLSIARASFFDIVRGEPQMAVRLLWQFVSALAARLARTSRDLDDARGLIGLGPAQAGRAAGAGAEEDPFHRPAVSALGQMRLGDEGGVVIESSPRPAQAPALADAPEMAQRVADVSPLADAPAQTTRLAERARLLDELEAGVPFDARRTRPGGRLREAVAEPAADRAATKPGLGSDPGDDSASAPAGGTIPIAPAEGLDGELGQLRRQYQERLEKSRKRRGDKDSD